MSAYHLLSSSSSFSSSSSCGMRRWNKGYPCALLPPSLSTEFQSQSSLLLSMPVSHVEKHAILFKLRLKLALRIKKHPPPRLFLLLLHPTHTLHISAFGYILMECHGVYRVRLRPKDARNIMSGSLWVTDLDIHIPTSWKLPSLQHHHLLAIRDSLRWRLDASSSSSSSSSLRVDHSLDSHPTLLSNTTTPSWNPFEIVHHHLRVSLPFFENGNDMVLFC